MKQRIGILILFIAAQILLFTSCSEDAAEEKKEEKYTNVEVITLKSQEYTDYVTIVGTIEPYNDAKISHETGGIIDRIVKDKGSYVSKGDTILILDNQSFKASMEAAKAQYELADVRFQKQQEVYNQNVGSEFEFLNAKYNRNQLKAVYDQARVMYEKSFIKAPFNGIVDSRLFDEGEFLPPATQVVRVIDATRLKIVAGVPERYAADIKVGAKTKVYIKELFDEPFDGKINYVGRALDPANRTFPVEILITNKNGLIKPDMLAEVSITKSVYENIVTVPEEVVTRTDNSYIVFVVNNGKAELRNVEILSRKGESVAVKSGLKEGDKLVVVGFQNLVDGENVSIVN